jgi:hypothetical protein
VSNIDSCGSTSRRHGTPGKNSSTSSVIGRLITVSGLAMMKTSAPVNVASTALRTACAASRASMYDHRFHLRSAGSASNEGNAAYSGTSITFENRRLMIFIDGSHRQNCLAISSPIVFDRAYAVSGRGAYSSSTGT